MTSESVRKSNSDPNSLGEWLNSTIEMHEDPFVGVLWPKDYERARSIANETGINSLIAIDNSSNSEYIEKLWNVTQKKTLSHKLAQNNPGEVDLEYSWAVADNVITRGPEEGLTAEDGMRKVLETSERMLKSGGVAVYNLESGTREELPYDSQMEFARSFEDILQEEYDVSPEIYESPEMRDSNTHLAWKKSL